MRACEFASRYTQHTTLSAAENSCAHARNTHNTQHYDDDDDDDRCTAIMYIRGWTNLWIARVCVTKTHTPMRTRDGEGKQRTNAAQRNTPSERWTTSSPFGGCGNNDVTRRRECRSASASLLRSVGSRRVPFGSMPEYENTTHSGVRKMWCEKKCSDFVEDSL